MKHINWDAIAFEQINPHFKRKLAWDGKVMVARTDNVTSVRNACAAKVTGLDVAEGERAILATGRLGTFRACFGARVLDADGGVAIDSASADLLDVCEGDEVWSVAR